MSRMAMSLLTATMIHDRDLPFLLFRNFNYLLCNHTTKVNLSDHSFPIHRPLHPLGLLNPNSPELIDLLYLLTILPISLRLILPDLSIHLIKDHTIQTYHLITPHPINCPPFLRKLVNCIRFSHISIKGSSHLLHRVPIDLCPRHPYSIAVQREWRLCPAAHIPLWRCARRNCSREMIFGESLERFHGVAIHLKMNHRCDIVHIN